MICQPLFAVTSPTDSIIAYLVNARVNCNRCYNAFLFNLMMPQPFWFSLQFPKIFNNTCPFVLNTPEMLLTLYSYVLTARSGGPRRTSWWTWRWWSSSLITAVSFPIGIKFGGFDDEKISNYTLHLQKMKRVFQFVFSWSVVVAPCFPYGLG